MGDSKNSLDYFMKALEMNQRLFKEDHPNLAESYKYIATHSYMTGQYGLAIQFLNEALKIYKRISQGDSTIVAQIFKRISLAYEGMQDFNNAKEYETKATEMFKRLP
jgi:tetratricopeptide (TPR) repeat protein